MPGCLFPSHHVGHDDADRNVSTSRDGSTPLTEIALFPALDSEGQRPRHNEEPADHSGFVIYCVEGGRTHFWDKRKVHPTGNANMIRAAVKLV